jgi:predicted nucleotidyltransferase
MAAKRIALKKVKEYVNEYIEALRIDGLPVERVFLFGSYVKGRTHKWSDIDVCVISPRFNRKIDPYEYLWTKRRRDDVLRGIEPVGFHPKDFIDENPLALEIKTTGIEIWPDDSGEPSTRKRKQEWKGASTKLLER